MHGYILGTLRKLLNETAINLAMLREVRSIQSMVENVTTKQDPSIACADYEKIP